MKSRIPQPKVSPEALRWKTRLEKMATVNLTENPTKIHSAENSNHVFFQDDAENKLPSIVGKVWGYGTSTTSVSSPGPILEATAGKAVKVEWINNLPLHHPFAEPPRELRSPGMMSRYDIGHTVVHLHGAHVPWTSDGYSIRANGLSKNLDNKKSVLRPGESEIFEYPNTQPSSSTLWYHDHTMDMTAMNVYAGLAGPYLLRHSDEHLITSLPNNDYEIPLIIQDRSFVEENARIEDDTDNVRLLYGDAIFLQSYLDNGKSTDLNSTVGFRQDFFAGNPNTQPSPEFKGQVICVNGKIWPFLEVEPRPYRFRIINGSNSRMYVLRVSGETFDSIDTEIPIHQIGADGSLLSKIEVLSGSKRIPKPPAEDIITVNSTNFLVLASGERADIIVDFSGKAGNTYYLTNHAQDVSPLGNGGDAIIAGTTDGILKFNVKSLADQNATSPLVFDAVALESDLTKIRSLPDLKKTKDDSTPVTRRYVIKEFGPVPLTIEEAIKDSPRGWKAITFQPNIFNPNKPGFLWGGLPPTQYAFGAVPNGRPFPDRVLPPHHLGASIELWEFYNLSPDVHPIHLHHSNMQLLSRIKLENPIWQTPLTPKNDTDANKIDANEQGWKDTIRMNPLELTRILVRFDDGSQYKQPGELDFDYTGHYVWHCHILEHEDMGMMRPLEIK
jgi:spore coat protein A, manganese oxidase